MGRTAFLATVIFASAFRGPVATQAIDPTVLSEWFFPETKAWTSVEKLPSPDVKKFDKLKDALRAACEKTDSNFRQVNACLISAILDPKGRNSLRIADINLDGINDVIYSGDAFCQEGDATLVWYGTKDGFQVKLDHIWPLRALKIRMGDEPRISSLAVGCCGDMIDTYFVGKLFNPRIEGSVQMYRGTAKPDKALIEDRPYQNASETILRSSPMTDDKYDPNLSGREDQAVFGNVLSRYLGGATGRVIFTQIDKDQRTWAFVIMSAASNPLRYHIGYQANVGWIRLKPAAKKQK